jgi:hypothetical protein
MLRTIESSSVDADTAAYLRGVQRNGGRGAAGLYLSGKKPNAAVYAILGIIILPVFLWMGYTTNKPAWANALIQTAGVMLGGWFIFAALRLTVLSGKNLGNFFYFDPNRVYIGTGDQLKYADVGDGVDVNSVGNGGLNFESEAGRFHVVVPGAGLANVVVEYYEALDHFSSDEEHNWGHLSAAERGAMAKYLMRHGNIPEDISDVELTNREVPDELRPISNFSLGWLRYFVILGLGAAAYCFFWFTNSPLQEGGAFAKAKDGTPAVMRDYLLNPNHTNDANRQEITKLLAAKYDAPIQKIRGNTGTEPKLRDAFLELVDTLRGPETPAVSLDVATTAEGVDTSWANKLRERLADGLGNTVGKEFIVFVAKPTDKPALMTLVYTTDAGIVRYRIDFRKAPDDEKPYYSQECVCPPQQPGASEMTNELIFRDLMIRMIGEAPPPAPPLPAEEGDW